MRLIDADKLHEDISNGPGTDLQKFFAACCVATAPTVNPYEWISVEDRFPEKGEYLVAYHPCWWDDVEYGKVCVGMDTFRGKTSWAKKKFQRVTHWMPFPEPPEN